MKKYLAWILALAMVFSMTACGEKKTEAPAPQTETPAETQTPEEPFEFPAKKVALHIASAAGGGFDLTGRCFTTEWGEALGTTFEYVYHDSNSCYMECVNELNSVRKGEYALMLGFDEALQAMFQFNDTPFTRDQVAVIGGVYSDVNVVMARIDDDRFNNMDDLFAYAKTAEKPITISTPSPLTPANMNATILVAASGMNANVVAYSGGSGARNDLLGGHVDLSVGSLETANNIRDQVKVLGILSDAVKAPEHFASAQLFSEFADFEMPDLSSHCYIYCSSKLVEEEPEVYNALVSTLEEVLMDNADVEVKLAEINRADGFVSAEQATAQSDAVAGALVKYADLLDPKLQ